MVTPDRSPTPGLARLPELRDRMTNAGMDIDLEADPTPTDLSPTTDLTCYRVVQESLTNALRHSLSKRATVRIHYEVDVVVINVSNPATNTPPSPSGLGIPGMRNRVTALGGHFTAGPQNDTFHVHARIPRTPT
ncbi:sensor histidine kinase [Actinokineospora soli]|uniref:histidine kinase n=1 Tax=Actinokineospora soli TaxID=1048753 RepID=A0ABW2TRS5_9PSEU